MQRNFVSFYSPGTFVSEETTKPIDTWNVDEAVVMARTIQERHGAKPYGFRFSTRSRGDSGLDSVVSATSPMHYLGSKIETREEVEARNDPSEDILRSNMRGNNIDRIIVNTNSWKFTAALKADDVVLDVVL